MFAAQAIGQNRHSPRERQARQAMNQAQRKIVQYLEQAQAMELRLVRAMREQAATAPPGSYRRTVEAHLVQTREHAMRVQTRLSQLGSWGGPLRLGLDLAERIFAQTLAVGRLPLELLSGVSAEERVLKSARDTCVNEATEIATYTALERLARSLGDRETAALAASILSEEQAMLEWLLSEIPKLTESVVRADVRGEPAYVLADGAVLNTRAAGRESSTERAIA
jgi:ferritin-like metal-binding protein YciE